MRLGLLAGVTKLNADWEKMPLVKELYVTGLDKISKDFLMRPNVDIRASPTLRDRTDMMIKDVGPAIWSRLSAKNSTRPWLFKPGDDRLFSGQEPRRLYPEDLYWDEHREL